ncbi:hypothetical protein TNCV_1560211 [Trichonephila clavipes]|nr:hypothetical protein TNCV_1560211 [Trichonephila clavipes]
MIVLSVLSNCPAVYKRANESRSGGPERKVQKGSEHRVPKRALSILITELIIRGRHNKEDQFDPEKARNDSPYIEERTRSSNKNARRGGDQQRQDQERREERVQRNPSHWRSW